MNRDRLEGSLKQLGGLIREQWGKLTANPLGVAAGRRERRFGRLQEQYGASMENAERQLEEFLARNRDWDVSGR